MARWKTTLPQLQGKKTINMIVKTVLCNSLTSGVSSHSRNAWNTGWCCSLTKNPQPSEQPCQTLSKINILLQYILAGEGGCFALFCFVLGFFVSVTVCCFQHHVRGWTVSFLPLPAVSFCTWQMLPSAPSAPRRAAATAPPSCFPCLLPVSSAGFTALECDFWINMPSLFLRNALVCKHSSVKIPYF